MRRLRIPRLWPLGFIFSFLMLYWHFTICYSVGATSRPWSIQPCKTYILPYVFLLSPAGISFFDDRRNYQWSQRLLISLALAINISLSYKVARDWDMGRPHFGPHFEHVLSIAPLLFPLIWLFRTVSIGCVNPDGITFASSQLQTRQSSMATGRSVVLVATILGGALVSAKLALNVVPLYR